MIRLDRYLSQLGMFSRRYVKKCFFHERIRINNQPATSFDQKIRYGDTIILNDQEILVKRFVTIRIYKPSGYVSSDVREGPYPSYKELLYNCPYRNMLHIAGRLDQDAEGLLIASNDGQLIHRIISPKHKLPKVYYVVLSDRISDYSLDLLTHGVRLDDGYCTLPAEVQRLDSHIVRFTLYEGKFHQVKRMFQAVGSQVVYLRRESIGSWNLDGLTKGSWEYI